MKKSEVCIDKRILSVEGLVEGVRLTFNEMLRENIYENNFSKEEIAKRMIRKKEIRHALKECPHGDRQAKAFIKDYLKEILINHFGVNEENIEEIIPFSSETKLTGQDKFEIMLYLLKKVKKGRALETFIEQYELSKPRYDSEGAAHYEIRAEEIREVYYSFPRRKLDFFDKLNIVVQRIYQNFKGNGVVDEIRDMHIDGVSAGVSGIPSDFELEEHIGGDKYPYSYDSIWIFYKGKSIHLSFLSFKSEKELIRVCKNIYRYQNPGQLSEVNGYMVNEMKDGSRVAVARPPFSETWVFFVRKFDSLMRKDIGQLITDIDKDIPILLIKWLVKGCQVMAITGEQGSGKTTLLMSLIHYINPIYNLRVQELSFELHLRKLYPIRNIVTFRETYSISGEEGLNFQKKTDGTVNILGEVTTAPVANWLISMSQVASLFTIFTHHAKTARDLLTSMRNALLTEGGFHSEKAAMEQVTEAINFDIHMKKREDGHRYIERITEIMPQRINVFQRIYTENKDVNNYESRDIVVFENGRYVVRNTISDGKLKDMLSHLNADNAKRLKEQLLKCGVMKENEREENKL